MTLKNIEFGQNVHKLLNKHGHSKFSHVFIQIFSLPLMRVLQIVCIVFHE